MWPFHNHKFKIEATTYVPPGQATAFKCSVYDTAKFLIARERTQTGLTTFVYRCQDESCCEVKVVEALGKLTTHNCEEKLEPNTPSSLAPSKAVPALLSARVVADRARLAALAEAATPGPWEAVHEHAGHHVALVGDLSIIGSDTAESSADNIDAAFIALARAAVPELLAALADAEADRDTWHATANDLGDERDRLRERVRLAEAWLESDDVREARQEEFAAWPSVEAAIAAREAFRASALKGGE